MQLITQLNKLFRYAKRNAKEKLRETSLVIVGVNWTFDTVRKLRSTTRNIIFTTGN